MSEITTANTTPHPSIAPVTEWPFDASKPFIISGPCSAETKDQVVNTALDLSATGKVSLLRAGIWKPRTRPGSFQGVGEPGLEWLVEAGKRAKLPVTTEVANAQHVELCLKAGIDVLWIGARTTVNPFSVQEIADALKGVDIPVIIKNPLNPDLQLWIGAIERFLMNGSTKLMAMHRGFATSYTGKYRNAPMWEIPIALKSHYPDLPVLCDPSHICGKRALLADVAQKALDLGFHGLMLESHPRPDEAWSDPLQQVTPADFAAMMDKLHFHNPHVSQEDIVNHLAHFRDKIDDIDEQLLRQLAQRMEVVDQIGQYKKENDITILQLERWKEILETRTNTGNRLGLDERTVQQLLELIHNLSIARQSDILNKGENKIMW